MSPFLPDIPPDVAEIIHHLPPEIKRSIKQAIRVLSEDPDAGEPFEENLLDCGNIEFDDIVLYTLLIELCVLSVLWRSVRGTGSMKTLPSEFAENENELFLPI